MPSTLLAQPTRPLPLLDDAFPDAVDDGYADTDHRFAQSPQTVQQSRNQLWHDSDKMPGACDDPGRQRHQKLHTDTKDVRQRQQKRVDEVCDDDRYRVDQRRDRIDKPARKRQKDLHSRLHQQRDGVW